MLSLDTLDRLDTIKADFADLTRSVALYKADFEASQQIAADHKHRAEIAEAALAAIKGALATVDGTISAPVEIKAEAQAEVSEYPAPEAPKRRRKSAPLTKPTTKAPTLYLNDLNSEHAELAQALTNEWQTVLQLHKSAQAHGFALGNQTVRNRMLALMADPYARKSIEQRDTPLAWRLKGGLRDKAPDKAKVEAPAPEAPVDPKPTKQANSDERVLNYIRDFLAGDGAGCSGTNANLIKSSLGLSEQECEEALRALKEQGAILPVGKYFWKLAPAPDGKTKLYGRLSPADRLKRDRLLLEALGDECDGRNYYEWQSAFEKLGGDVGGDTKGRGMEAHRGRLANLGLVAKVVGTSGHGRKPRFKAWPNVAEALAKLEGASPAPTFPDALNTLLDG